MQSAAKHLRSSSVLSQMIVGTPCPLPLGGEGGPPPAFFSRGETGEGVSSLRSVSDITDSGLRLSSLRMTCR
jgi:hypothetical protein